MKFFQRRRYRKWVKQVLQEAQHACHMREDIADPNDLKELLKARQTLADAWKVQSTEQIDAAVGAVADAVDTVYPEKTHAKFRENYEILVVALAVAMAFRTYFIQPFKIPTGSMQPTLNGITYHAQEERSWSDRFPVNTLKQVVLGQMYKEVRATISGHISQEAREYQGNLIIYINQVPHQFNKGMARHFRLGEYVEKGDVLASGIRTFGDHIFVDKVRYNFSRPKRGDIIVFDTAHIEHSQIRPDTFYIKRCVGLPGEEIAIEPPYVLADGQKITEPYPFQRLLNDEAYEGHQLAIRSVLVETKLAATQDRLQLSDSQYLPLGDNTRHSLDGRYFGGVERRDLVGPAFCVYWPFGEHVGRVR